jgi:dephospho-CoA kinase
MANKNTMEKRRKLAKEIGNARQARRAAEKAREQKRQELFERQNNEPAGM